MKVLLAGLLGAGDSEVASKISRGGETPVFNSHRAIRDLIRERGETFQLFETESSSGTYDLDVLLRNKAFEYMEMEDQYIVEGRLGLLVCDHEFDIKIFLTANLEDRAKHVSKRRGIALQEAREVVEMSDKDRRYVFEKINDKPLVPSEFDLTINTSDLSLESTAEVIQCLLESMQRRPSPHSPHHGFSRTALPLSA